jgi:RNA polymerase sigma-70 factor (sigma-E family)
MTHAVPEEALSMRVPAHADGAHEPASEPGRAELVDVLFRRHYPALLRLAFVMLGDRGAAEDAVQDAFVSLHRNWKRLRDRGAAEAYLRSAVLNRSRSWVRRQVRQRAVRPLRLVPNEPENPADAAVARDEVGSLVTAMRTLARRQREVLACRFVLELTVGETAELLEISEGSVKAHTHRGLRALQQRIEVTP